MKVLRYISIFAALSWYVILIENSDYKPETNSERWTTILTLTIIIVAFGYGVQLIVKTIRDRKK